MTMVLSCHIQKTLQLGRRKRRYTKQQAEAEQARRKRMADSSSNSSIYAPEKQETAGSYLVRSLFGALVARLF